MPSYVLNVRYCHIKTSKTCELTRYGTSRSEAPLSITEISRKIAKTDHGPTLAMSQAYVDIPTLSRACSGSPRRGGVAICLPFHACFPEARSRAARDDGQGRFRCT